MPILVYGHGLDEEPFWEETHTLIVNAQGALIGLAASVALEQRLVLTNLSTGAEAECHVVYVGQMRDAKIEVGVEFTRPAPRFWNIAFPPKDWKRRE